ncbi:hypothetical protein TKK_0009924 [Trichogramma kaykai]
MLQTINTSGKYRLRTGMEPIL